MAAGNMSTPDPNYPIAGHAGQPSAQAPPPPKAPQPAGGGDWTYQLTRRLGPLPVWAWGLVAAAGLYLWQKYQGTRTPAVTAGSTAATAPAGVDPSTGETYAQEYGAAAEQLEQYQDAAQNPAAAAGGAVPAVSTDPAPVAPPSGGTAPVYPAPSSVVVTGVTSDGATISWSAITSPTPVPSSYQVAVYNKSGIIAAETTVAAGTGTISCPVTGLEANQSYTVSVWANGGAAASPGGSASFTTT